MPGTSAPVEKCGHEIGDGDDRVVKLGEIATQDVEFVSVA